MKNQKLQRFTGNYIIPFGKPIVIVTGWIAENELYCERFVMFEKRNGKMIKKGICTKISMALYNAVYNQEDKEQALLAFMKQEGENLAEADIFSIVADMMEEAENWERSVIIDVKLTPTESLMDLIHLHRKFPDDLKWLEQNTQLIILKERIHIAKMFTSEENIY